MLDTDVLLSLVDDLNNNTWKSKREKESSISVLQHLRDFAVRDHDSIHAFVAGVKELGTGVLNPTELVQVVNTRSANPAHIAFILRGSGENITPFEQGVADLVQEHLIDEPSSSDDSSSSSGSGSDDDNEEGGEDE